jgi:hypothetical protein
MERFGYVLNWVSIQQLFLSPARLMISRIIERRQSLAKDAELLRNFESLQQFHWLNQRVLYHLGDLSSLPLKQAGN